MIKHIFAQGMGQAIDMGMLRQCFAFANEMVIPRRRSVTRGVIEMKCQVRIIDAGFAIEYELRQPPEQPADFIEVLLSAVAFDFE